MFDKHATKQTAYLLWSIEEQAFVSGPLSFDKDVTKALRFSTLGGAEGYFKSDKSLQNHRVNIQSMQFSAETLGVIRLNWGP